MVSTVDIDGDEGLDINGYDDSDDGVNGGWRRWGRKNRCIPTSMVRTSNQLEKSGESQYLYGSHFNYFSGKSSKVDLTSWENGESGGSTTSPQFNPNEQALSWKGYFYLLINFFKK